MPKNHGLQQTNGTLPNSNYQTDKSTEAGSKMENRQTLCCFGNALRCVSIEEAHEISHDLT